jgi:Multicopper oxidase
VTRRAGVIGVAVAVLALVASPTVAAMPSTAVGVGLREFRVALYRSTARAGDVRLNLRNYGEDVHDLAVRRDGRTYGRTAPVPSGGLAVLRVRLRRPGRYTVLCLVADHARRGMRATLRVRRASQPG